VWVAALRRADPLSEESYQISARFIVFEFILRREEARGTNPIKDEELPYYMQPN
jgi:hypothetical protein